MGKSLRKTIDQQLAAAEALLASKRAKKDEQMKELGYCVERARNLPAPKVETLKAILLEANPDKGDRQRIERLFAATSE